MRNLYLSLILCGICLVVGQGSLATAPAATDAGGAGSAAADKAAAPQEPNVQEVQRLADQGDASAQTLLGAMYEQGLGVTKDERKAVEWYQKAAEQGHAEAQYNLGVMYYGGHGVSKDDRKAVEWWQKAADQGHATAEYNLGVMYKNGRGVGKDERKAVEWYRKAADQGYAAAQNNLGLMYDNGRGVTKDERKAVEWYRKAADQGDAAAQNNLGLMYKNGRGVAQDERKAVEWCRKAADQGHATAQYNLGVMYENGRGVAQDERKAMEWYQKAADQGDEDAKIALAAMKNQTAPAAHNPGSPELFGVRLKDATRAQLRAAFKKSPLQVKREQDQYWVDLYDSSETLEGSSQLAVGYTDAGRFAYAEYTFPSHIDTQQVQRIVDMVAAKYGKPDRFSGNVGLGKVEAVWQKGKDVVIKVYRGWPDTTTYLHFSDTAAEDQMNAEVKAEKAAQTRQKAATQSQAF